jgi:hypothetical protein
MRLLPILLLLIVLVVLLLPRVSRIRPSAPRARPTPPDELVKDPVCQTYIVKSRAIRRTEAGEVRYFCSEQCARLGTRA